MAISFIRRREIGFDKRIAYLKQMGGIIGFEITIAGILAPHFIKLPEVIEG